MNGALVKTPIARMCFRTALVVAVLFVYAPDLAGRSPRERLSLDRHWKFALGHAADPDSDFAFGRWALFAKTGEPAGALGAAFNDSAWRAIDLPHDWVVDLPFVYDRNDAVKSHGYKPVGRDYPATSIGWYRRRFAAPAGSEGRRLRLAFDGVYRDCQVWLNGHFIGRHLSGYTPFEFDVSAYVLHDRPNILVVRVDATHSDGWFYEGAGIYRHVWLDLLDPVHVPTGGVAVRSVVGQRSATVGVETEIVNTSARDEIAEVRSVVVGPDGRRLAETRRGTWRIPARERITASQELVVEQPRLWSLEDPALHRLETRVIVRGIERDSLTTTFGIRTLRWDKDRGFFLNGKHVTIQGVCNHQDHAGVGAAVPDRLQAWRIERLKEMGANAYRSSHNPPTAELLDACDRLGMLVMDETRLLGASDEALEQWTTLIRRDRNRPSVILWSIGNEEWFVHTSSVGERIAREMLAVQERLDPTRVSTYAANNGTAWEGINKVMPVRGFNYMAIGSIDEYRKAHPDQPLVGSEEASTVSTRGVVANDTVRGYLSDNDVNHPSWGSTAQSFWSFYAARPWLAGGFVWTGFDYRGEPTPYGWPCINSHFGIMDVCGFPKTIYYYYQSWWSDRDVLHLAPHWNQPAPSGSPVEVWCESNCDSVELDLNGRSLGWRTMPRYGHLRWTVPYEPGELKARGIRNGRTIEHAVTTTGAPVALKQLPDRHVIDADGQDLSVISVCALDAQGRIVPTADAMVKISITGPGAIIGVGNGDPSSHEPDHSSERRLFNGWCQVIVQSGRTAGPIRVRAEADGLRPFEAELQARSVTLRPSLD